MGFFTLYSLSLLYSFSSAGVDIPYYSDWGPPEGFTDTPFQFLVVCFPLFPSTVHGPWLLLGAWKLSLGGNGFLASVSVSLCQIGAKETGEQFGLSSLFFVCVCVWSGKWRAWGQREDHLGTLDPRNLLKYGADEHAGLVNRMICFFPSSRLPKKM